MSIIKMGETDGVGLFSHMKPPDRNHLTSLEKRVERTGLTLTLVIWCAAIFYQLPRLILMIFLPTLTSLLLFLSTARRYPNEGRNQLAAIVLLRCAILLATIYAWKHFGVLAQQFGWASTAALLIVNVEAFTGKLLLRQARTSRRGGEN